MKRLAAFLFTVAWIGCALAVVGIRAQEVPRFNPHLAKARAAADGPTIGCRDATDLFNNLCGGAPPGGGAQPAAAPQAAAAQPAQRQPRPIPARSTWYMEPMKVFDNLYYVGSYRESSWVIETSEGLIILDTMSAYAAEDAIWEGLKKLGFDPAKDVKIIVLSHGHGDHYGGAKFLQDHIPGVKTYLTAADWDLIEQSTSTRNPKPKRDLESYDKMKLTLGDTTLEFHLIPGHTPGNTSVLIPVMDGGRKHMAMFWGGTALQQTGVEYFRTYAKSVADYRPIVAAAGADVILGGHSHRDGSRREKWELLATRKPGDPHPYVIGPDGVDRVLTVISECAAYRGDLAALAAGDE